MFDTTKIKKELNKISHKLEDAVQLHNLEETLNRIGNWLILGTLLFIIKKGYSLKLGWTPKKESTLKRYEKAHKAGLLKLTPDVDKGDWEKGLVKTGNFYTTIKSLAKENLVTKEGEEISFVVDFGEVEEELSYMRKVRFGDRDYITSLLKVVNEKLKNDITVKNDLKQLIESIIKNVFI